MAALVVGIGLVVLAARPAPASVKDLVRPPTAYAADLSDGTTLGSRTAPVVIDLYADFQCPACRQFVMLELPHLVRDYVVRGIVRIEAMDIDILGHGQPDESLDLAVGAACAAEQDRYWQFHDLVFWNQGRENRGDHDRAFIAAVADRAGLLRAPWESCQGRADVGAAVRSRTATAAAQGIAATPTLRINGTIMVGVPVYAELMALVDRLAGEAPGATGPVP